MLTNNIGYRKREPGNGERKEGTGKMPRQARLDAPGTLHHVIVRGIEKRKIFDDGKDGENFVKRMGEIVLENSTTIYACC